LNSKFDALKDNQKEVAPAMVDNALDGRMNKGTKKLTQKDLGEIGGVEARTIRNWQRDILFLEYVQELSKMKLAEHAPQFVAVLISNLNGANPSTKQLDLFAKIADMLPEKEATQHNTNVMIGNNDDIRARIEQLEAERRANVIPNVPDRDRQIEEETMALNVALAEDGFLRPREERLQLEELLKQERSLLIDMIKSGKDSEKHRKRFVEVDEQVTQLERINACEFDVARFSLEYFS